MGTDISGYAADGPMRAFLIHLPVVSVVIPAYNEERFIGQTLTSILESGFPCEVVVVDDGSTDRTSQILEDFRPRIRIVRHPVNRGKGAAMASGVRAATGEVVVFCDAHLLGLQSYHLLSLVLPLVQGPARAVLGVGLPGITVRPQFLMPLLTGQRAYFRRDLEPLLEEMEGLGYGVELFLFHRFPRERTVVVVLPGLVHLLKPQVSSPQAAARGYLRESLEILRALASLGEISPTRFSRWRQKVITAMGRYMYTIRDGFQG
ncbi:MAG: glycosyltransferase family 2 protein [Anaerolineae bacterium]|nr:glycosyltransferase [Anaerolineae bacterium]MDW8067847.1 glycosyltransferase family 2 protein [Anaerolineae bacterium]